ncbi:cardiolipin synthase [Carnobacterium maltaromaticum]|uniref:cardiolipin synthase n=1 Tax=Carnobacterium maltaromaticum TaxID=2751 RepID=UPI000C783E64|nr:cardiolipin synthase [Carnobacterium maltaromaticum]PLS38206.1 cardiolipin synthase [Carnobacterium maltaromaticum]PLS38583.1 cardiolipin synthase [Carnobacterium maltaromaticum]PLS38960.1 cardiolipin synthase [Carnobacterium maltaromaticum]PLS45230.1 cardiolipin synthase [Carnobacterium maltaromaticum]PLS48085.1 cardiolipin synthase [Carnobacterium maltaromaticum]
MSTFMLVMQGIFIINTVFAILTVFREKRDIAATWAWLLVLVLLPIVGFIAYLFIGKKISREKIFDIKTQESMGMKELVMAQKEMLLEDELLSTTQATENAKEMASLFLESDESIVTKGNKIKLFIDGHKKFDSLVADIQNAEHHIHMLYYTIHQDELGRRVLAALEERAAAGVEVLVIYDAMGSRSTKHSFFKRLESLGGKAEPFFGSHWAIINLRLNYRNHRKIVVIDGKIGYVGGFNVGDEYLGKDKKFGYWRDTHLRIEGNAVLALQSRFAMDWNAAVDKHKIEYKEEYFPIIHNKGKSNMQIVSSGPDSEQQQIKKGYIKMISMAKKSIYIQSPYFIPDDSVLDAISIAAMSGIDVRIMIPNKPDHPFVYRATTYYAGEMVAAGAKVYIYDNGFLHAKTMVIDGEIASVGTANLDFRSFKLNFEVNAFIYDPVVAMELKTIYEKDMEECYLLTKEILANQSRWMKFKQEFSRLLSPIL